MEVTQIHAQTIKNAVTQFSFHLFNDQCFFMEPFFNIRNLKYPGMNLKCQKHDCIIKLFLYIDALKIEFYINTASATLGF